MPVPLHPPCLQPREVSNDEPQAVMLCIKDAIELLVERQLAPLAEVAVRSFREGAVEPVEPPRAPSGRPV